MTIITSIAVFLILILFFTGLLLVAKSRLSPSGSVTIRVNEERSIESPSGGTLLSVLQSNGIFLSSACGGSGSCGQCRCRVMEGGGEILPTEVGFFSRKQIKDRWRLGCQTRVRENMSVRVPDAVLGVKEWECTVVSNSSISTYIKEFIVSLPVGEHMIFQPGSYAQIRIPRYEVFFRDYDIEERFRAEWSKNRLWELKGKNTEETVRAYSMANYPAEGDRITLNVRIAVPPFDRSTGIFRDVPPGVASTYIFSLRPGDKVIMNGPYGDFHPILDTKNEMMWIGGGAGMAPLRSQIMHLTRTLNVRDRKMSYFYGARALNEVFYLEDFLQLEEEFPNFSFHLALDRPDPAADALGVRYTPGFVHRVIYDTYLSVHDSPEDIEYYMCGPGPMSKAVESMLWDLGVPRENLMFDDFG
ncbi:MAG: NADH:ubiquinone reductase (Na(+)-transporting) subunit F [Dysgonamonadaceae bacterium]|nr:NADH:ubiquinone reductase (Na(+)-transporting) subunit F [Dysgonamonadaceae bacterium]